MFNFPLIEGNPKTCLSDGHSIVLSEDEAKKQFGTRQAIGKIVMMKNEDAFVPYTVTGVAKKCPQNSSIKFQILLPMQESVEDAQNSENWFNYFLNTFVVLSPRANVQAAEAKMKKFYDEDTKGAIKSLTAKYGPEAADWKADYQLQPFLDMHLSKELPPQNGLSDASNPVYSYILSGIAIFILLIASINFVNLTIARSVKRAKEIGIRKVLGANIIQITTLITKDYIKLILYAGMIAVPAAYFILQNWLKDYAFHVEIGVWFFVLPVALIVVIALLTVLYQSLKAALANPVNSLRSE